MDPAATLSIFTIHKGTKGVSETKKDLENQIISTKHAHGTRSQGAAYAAARSL